MRKLSVLIAAMALVSALVTSAQGKVEVSGSLSLETSWSWRSEEASESGEDRLGLYRFGVGESTLGITYSSDDKRFEGYAELSMYGRGDGNTVETGAAYMVYNGESCSWLLGYEANFSDDYGPSQVLDDGAALEGFGNSVLDTNEQIRFTYGDKYKFMVAIENPYKEGVWDEGGSYNWLPGLSAAAELTFGNVVLHPWGHFEWINWESGAEDDSYYSLDMGLDISGDFGLVGFTAAINYGINSAQNEALGGGEPLVIDNVVEENVRQLGVWGELRISGLALGAGYAVASRDDWDNDPHAMAAYANYSIEFGMITFTPGIVWFNHGEDETGAELGSTFLFGLWSSMEF